MRTKQNPVWGLTPGSFFWCIIDIHMSHTSSYVCGPRRPFAEQFALESSMRREGIGATEIACTEKKQWSRASFYRKIKGRIVAAVGNIILKLGAWPQKVCFLKCHRKA